MRLRISNNQDLTILTDWIPDTKNCRYWAGSGVSFPFTVESLKKDINYSRSNTFSLEDTKGNYIGLGQIIEKEKYLHLARIIISPTHRGKGFGEILCKKLIKRGRLKYGDRPFSLNVYSKNKKAQSLYLKLGFTPVNKPTGFSSASDCIFMILL
jgi:ribosomal protein S18 acetylase RimI-like enzyme